MIDSFTGQYFFLSNFYDAPVVFEGIEYKNNEAAFQAQKTTDPSIRARFSVYPPNIAKREGRRVSLRPDWESVKDEIMYQICLCKFEQNRDCLEKLLSTKTAKLVEGNTWGDTYWGVCNGVGENHLGEILMRVRSELSKQNKDIYTNEEWVKSLTRKRLAELLIREKVEPDYDEGIDGEIYYLRDITCYVTSDGMQFYEDYDGAIEHECWWLAQIRTKEAGDNE